ncbi:protein MpCYP716-like22 [Marchantia polymorpha subsp. ruderalis]|nr:hypothetical protein MARPO_0129s0043 [Marchantia polymorpha]BBN01774.1 hypothetical protein Mp_2g10200 [Marchantia polymorpha subsp. ruderalis]|eukprot:PTQ30157.1 hypothetical protein MARPO_0129s0043 [Marchantia polymorpha]
MQHSTPQTASAMVMSPELCGAAIITAVYVLLMCMRFVWIDCVHYQKVADMYEKDDQQRGRRPPPVPPGSLGLPYVGDTITYLIAVQNSDLRSYFDKKVESYGDIFKVSLFGRTTVFLDLIDGTDFLFRNEGQGELSLLPSHWSRSIRALMESSSLPFTEGPIHKVLKNHWQRNFFDVSAVSRRVQTIEELAVKHIREHWPGQSVEMASVLAHDAISLYTFDVVCELCLGVKDPALVQKLRLDIQVYAEGFYCLPLRFPGSGFYRACEAKKRLTRMLELVIVQRRHELLEGRAPPTHDFLCVLLSQRDETGLSSTDQEIAAQMLLMLFAGQKPTADTLTHMIELVAAHPNAYAKLLQEHAEIASVKKEAELLSKDDLCSMRYSWRVLQETLRLFPVSANLFREAATAFQYKGFTINKGWKVAASAARVRSEPEMFRDADSFDPSRFEDTDGGAPPYSHFPFGGGLRMCPGDELAKQVIFVFFHHLLKNAQWRPVEAEHKVAPSYTCVPSPSPAGSLFI